MFQRSARQKKGKRMVQGPREASAFEDAGIEVTGLQECRLPSQLVVREAFVMVTSETEDGRDETRTEGWA